MLRRKVLPSLLLAAGLLVLGAAHAQVDRATAEGLLRQSPLSAHLIQMADLAQAAWRTQGLRGEPSAPDAATVAPELGEVFAAGRLHDVAAQALADRLDDALVADLRRWFDSPRGRSITALEAGARGQSALQQVFSSEPVMQFVRFPVELTQPMVRLSAATRAAEVRAQILFDILKAVARQKAGMATSPHTPGRSLQVADAVTPLVDAERRKAQQSLAGPALKDLFRIYGSLPAADLKAYVEFTESEAGRRFTALCFDALVSTMADATVELDRRLSPP